MGTINLADAARGEQIESLKHQLEQASQHDRAYLEEARPENEVFAQDFEELEEVVLTESCEPSEDSLSATPEPKFLDQIKSLPEGTWVEMTQEDGTPLRCRLATVVQPGHRYVFVNQRGMKVAEQSGLNLAAELQRGSLNILDDSQIFDRALQVVIGNLRRMRSTGTR